MRIVQVFFIAVAITFLAECSAYRILGVFPYNGRSHFIVFEALLKGLAKRGHQVDVISHFPLKKPMKNYNDIVDLSGTMASFLNNRSIEFKEEASSTVVSRIAFRGNNICNLMGTDKFQEFVKNPSKYPQYDAIIVEAFTANCYMGLGYIFKAPVIAISSSVEYPWITEFTGNNDNPAYVPNAFQTLRGHMTFWDRLNSFIDTRIKLSTFNSLSDDAQTSAMRKYLSPDIPNIREVEKNVVLTFANSHPIMYGVKPMTPMLVQIAGLHVEENQDTLPPELQKWMDESKDGVVYFSFGSMLLIETTPTDQLKELYSSFESIAPVRVLMKIVDKSKLPPGLPSNVKVLSWMPQIPILRHPNTKAFLTHGGLGGSLEALYFGVPMIGMPLYGDQLGNCQSFIAKGMLIQVDYKKFSAKAFNSALSAIIHNKTYKEKAVYYSKLFRDQPMSTMDKANFWIEYVIRNGPVLRSPALDYTWWQLALIDVYAFILIVTFFVLFIILFVLKSIIQYSFKVCRKNTLNIKDNKKKN